MQSGLLVSHRGIKGGYVLAREPHEISIVEMIAAIEGPMALTECSSEITGLCNLGALLPDQEQPANHQPGRPRRARKNHAIRPGAADASDDHQRRARPSGLHDCVWENSMSSNTDTIRELAQQEYKWGFVTDIGEDRAPKGLKRRDHPLHLSQEERTGVHAGMAAEGFSPLADAREKSGRAEVGQHPLSAHRLSGHLYYSAPKQKPNLKSLDELDPEILRTYEKLGIPLAEQKMLAGVAVDAVFDSVSVATTFKEKLAEVGVIFCSFSEAVQKHPDLVKKYLGSVVPLHGQLFRRAECRCLYRRFFRLRPQGRALPDGAFHLFPHQRRGNRTVRAHPDRRRRRRVRQLSRRLHRADSRRKPAARRGRRTDRARRRANQIFHRPKLVSRRQERQGRNLQLRHQARRRAAARIPRSPGRRSKPARRSPGNIRAASCRAKIPSANFIPSRSPTTTSRPTPARR